MISKPKLYLFIIFLLMGLIASNAFADFYVVAGGGKKVGTEIKALPYDITSPGFYFITRDLHCGDTSHGITISAHNVTLDLMRFTLFGPGSDTDYNGIYMANRKNVEIRNGTVRDFDNSGIREYGPGLTGEGHRIINIRAIENGAGIYLFGNSHLI